MKTIEDTLQAIDNDENRATIQNLFKHIKATFPQLETTVKWNQPMFTHHDTFIIGFSFSKAHFSVTPEAACLKHYRHQLDEAGYSNTENLFRVKWHQDIPFHFIQLMIERNLNEKKDVETFWRNHK